MATPSGSCAGCGASATKRCAACIEGVDQQGNPSPTFYCSIQCQKASWKAHKADCRIANARKELYRGAELVQDVYYAFREISFDYGPTQIKLVDDKIHFHLPKGTDEWHDPTGWPLYPFPKHALPNVQDQKALLVWNSCEDSMAYMHELLQKVFKDIVANDDRCRPQEYSLSMKDEHKTIMRHLVDGILDEVRFQHVVLVVRLKKEYKFYVIDLAGAQFRQYRAATPDKEYVEKWVRARTEQNAFGYHNRRFKNAVQYKNDPAFIGSDMRDIMTHLDTAKVLNRAATQWEEKAGKTLAQMLKQKQSTFETDKAAFIKTVLDGMQDWLDWFKAQPVKFERYRNSDDQVADLPPWEDEKAAKKLLHSPDMLQDTKHFLGEELRKGTQIIECTPGVYTLSKAVVSQTG